jgi:DNA-binding transcriptional MerR regulator
VNRRTDRSYRGVPSLLEGKLGPEPLTAVAFRVSARDAEELKNNVQAATTKLGALPAIAHLKTLDLETLLLDKTPHGERLRGQVGLIPIRRENAHRHALQPGQLMGYALPVPAQATIFFMLFDSAAKPTVKNPDELLPSNAVCELLSQICLMPRVHDLYFPEWSRWVRDPRYGATVRTAAQRGGTNLHVGLEQVDITTSTGTIMAGVRDGESSGEKDKIRTRTTSGVLSQLTGSRMIWAYARALVPPAYELEHDRFRDSEGKSRRARYLQSATGEHAAGWQRWAEVIADGGTFLAAGRHLAAARISARGTRHTNLDSSSKTYDELSDKQLERASRSLAEHVRSLRTRTYKIEKEVPVPLQRGDDFEGHEVDHDDRGDKNGFGMIRRTVQLPPHCLTLTDEQWDNWERRIHGRTPRDTRTDGPRAPFSDIRQQWFTTDSGDRRRADDDDWTINWRIRANGDSYEVFSRSRAEALDDRGELRGWDEREGTHGFTARRADIERGYAWAGIAITAGHVGGFEPVLLEQRPLPDPAEQQRRRLQRLDELEDLTTRASDDVEDAEQRLGNAERRGRGVDGAAAELQEARDRLQALTEERLRLHSNPVPEPAQSEIRTVAVDISTPAHLFGILDGAAGHRMPRTVADLLHRLSGVRLDVKPDAGLPRMLRITDILDWPADDGTVVPLRIDFVVENRKRDLAEAAREKARRESAAALILRDGYTVDAVADQLGWTRAETVTRVRAWLKDHPSVNIPTRGGRSAIVDCPLRETKRAVWNAVTGGTACDGDEQFEQLVAPRYLAPVSHANSWIGRDVTLDRQVLAVFTALLGQGIDLTGGLPAGDIAARAGCTTQQVMYLCDGPNEKYRGVLERVTGPGRRVRPRRCHAGHWLLHVLPTLETAQWSGLLCDVCRATPDGLELPPGYFELWNGPTGAHHDLAATVGTTLTEAPPPAAPGARPRPLLTIGEAAAYLQVSTSALREWSNDGLVPCEQRPRRYDQRVLDGLDVRALVGRYHATYGQRTADDGRLTLPQVTERLGVPEHYLRAFLVDTGKLAAGRGGSRGNTLLFEVADVDAVPQEWRDRHAADLIGIGAAAQRLGMTVPQLRTVAAAGRVPSLLTDGGTRRFRLADLDVRRHTVDDETSEAA